MGENAMANEEGKPVNCSTQEAEINVTIWGTIYHCLAEQSVQELHDLTTFLLEKSLSFAADYMYDNAHSSFLKMNQITVSHVSSHFSLLDFTPFYSILFLLILFHYLLFLSTKE